MLKKILSLDVLCISILILASFFLVAELFLSTGQPAAYDTEVHIRNIVAVYKAFLQGEIRVMWADGIANYGMPFPLISQQLTMYLGAFFLLLTKNIVFSYHLVYFIGAAVSTILFYTFLRFYFKPEAAFGGALLFNFEPYRIINIYIRGAQPEFFASSFIVLLLLGIFLLFHKNSLFGFSMITLGSFLLALTHPIMFIVGGFLFVPYFIFNLLSAKNKIGFSIWAILGLCLGVGMAGYYILPLKFETKYLYFGQAQNHFLPGHFLTLQNYFDPRWYYFSADAVFTRDHFMKVDWLETGIIIIGTCFLLWHIFFRKINKIDILTYAVLTGILIIFFTTGFSTFFYERISLLGEIQHQWRMLSVLIFIPPLILAYLLDKMRKGQMAVIFGLLILIAFARFPQLYGKNYTLSTPRYYSFTPENVYAVIMNTVWTGEVREYPHKPNKIDIIEGTGEIIGKNIKNSSRNYMIIAKTPLRLVDYTFYFPGWSVFVDGRKANIEFQDPKYRGVITYRVPSGKHTVFVAFENTKTRILGYGMTIISLLFFILVILMRKRIRVFKK